MLWIKNKSNSTKKRYGRTFLNQFSKSGWNLGRWLADVHNASFWFVEKVIMKKSLWKSPWWIRWALWMVTSMLVTDVGDEMCWWKAYGVGDGFRHFGHYNPLSFYVDIGHKHLKDVTKIEILSPTSKICHQLRFTNITVTALNINTRKGSEIHWTNFE